MLYNVLKRSVLELVKSVTLESINEITSRCEPYERIKNAPLLFLVNVGHENVKFNARTCIDIMYLDGESVLLIVREATQFSSARFLTKVATDETLHHVKVQNSGVKSYHEL